MITPPWQHQTDALEFIRDKPGALLAADMGVGKSRTVVDLIRERGYQRVLIVCPLAVIPVWPGQFAQWWGPHAVTVTCLDRGTVARKRETAELALRSNLSPTVVVVNYESAWRPPLGPWLVKQEWDLVVMDEGHKLRSPSGKASWWAKAIGARVPQRLALSGTPLPHDETDAYALYRFLDPRIFGISFTRFKQRYTRPHPVFPGQVLKDRQTGRTILINEEEFQQKYHSIAFRVRADDVLDLPPVQHIERPVTLEPGAQRVYAALEKDFYAQVEDGEVTASNALTKLLRLAQITGGHLRQDDGTDLRISDAKADVLTELLENIDEEESVVVFARFRADLQRIHESARKAGRSSGELSGQRRELAEWQAGETRVLAVQIASGGVGIDLTRARYCIYYSIGYSLAEYEQSLARTHRPGQTRHVFYYHLTAGQTVDEQIYAALQQRRDVVAAIVDRATLAPVAASA